MKVVKKDIKLNDNIMFESCRYIGELIHFQGRLPFKIVFATFLKGLL